LKISEEEIFGPDGRLVQACHFWKIKVPEDTAQNQLVRSIFLCFYTVNSCGLKLIWSNFVSTFSGGGVGLPLPELSVN